MALIDSTYFVGDIDIPSSSYGNLSQFITTFEEEALRNLLGNSLYDLMQDNQESAPFTGLIDGAEYEVIKNGLTYTVKWNGLKNAKKVSLVAYYVYCQYMRDKVTFTSNVGERKHTAENSRSAQIMNKVLSAYVKFEKLYGYESQDELVPSAYNYLYKHSDSFPLWVFTDLKGGINSHDL